MHDFDKIEKIAEIKREIEMRHLVYGRKVARGEMKQSDANRRIWIMEAILQDYESEDGP